MSKFLNYKFLNQANVYILLWCVYYLQGTIYASGSLLSQSILLILLLISLCNYLKVVTTYKLPLYFRGLNTLLLMFILYGIVLLLSGQKIIIQETFTVSSNHEYLKSVLISLLPIFSAFLYTKQGLLTPKMMRLWIPIWILIALLSYYSYQQLALSILVTRDEITNNVAYRFVALMPILILLYKKPIFMFCAILFCLLFILMGMKRGAILIAAVNLLIVLFYMYKVGSKKMKFFIILSSFIICVALVISIEQLLLSSDYFASRIDATLDGDTSGRGDIYSSFWNYFINQSNLLNLLFGNGADATLIIGYNYAHNDWLEILINQGVIGASIYLLYFILFYKSILYRGIGNPFVYIGLKMIFSTVFLSTIFSMSYASMDIFLSLSLGFFLALSNINNNCNCKNKYTK